MKQSKKFIHIQSPCYFTLYQNSFDFRRTNYKDFDGICEQLWAMRKVLKMTRDQVIKTEPFKDYEENWV